MGVNAGQKTIISILKDSRVWKCLKGWCLILEKIIRLAMTWALAGLCSHHAVDIIDFDCISVSFPRFLEVMRGLA